MGFDPDLAGILREVVQFLESLCEIDLPLKIENARENLMQRSRAKLSTLTSNRGSTSPEPYLDMNAGKGLLLFSNRKEIEIEEYVGVDEQSPPSHQDYYESFQEIDKTVIDKIKNTTTTSKKTNSMKIFNCGEEAEEKLLEIYKTFTPSMTMNKAHKFGSLDHKVERKSFGFVRGNIRSCWIGLVGSHLLIYSSEKDKQPPEICSIRGYMGRPASNATFKDQEQAKSAFEIFCPGNKTLQFIAKTPREMEEWLAAVSRTNLSVQDRDSGMYERSMDEKIETELPDDSVSVEERYQDVRGLLSSPIREEPVVLKATSQAVETSNGNKVARSDSEKKKESVASVSPPALPVRLPRRLPSLPTEAALIPSYEPLGDEEDDIYHKIEDFRENGRSYENVKNKAGKRVKAKKMEKKKQEKKEDKKKKSTEEYPELEAYDEVETNKHVESKKDDKNNRRISLLQESPRREVDAVETYDDVQAITQDTQTPAISNSRSPRKDLREIFETSNERNSRSSFTTYDDVLQPLAIISTDANAKTEACKPTESQEATATGSDKSPTKSPQKRSFLDRVRNRKDSTKKEEKKKIENANSSAKKTEKKEKRKVSLEKTPQTCAKLVEPDLPTYDDVSQYINDLNSQNTSQSDATVPSQMNDHSNYNCPPPPRPIYVNPPNPVLVTGAKKNVEIIEDIYDDIANYRDTDVEIEKSTEVKKSALNYVAEEKVTAPLELKTPEKPKINKVSNNGVVANGAKSPATRISTIIDESSHNRDNKPSEDTEHYQTPRTDPVQVNPSVVLPAEQEEQLYDDIAILAEFRAKQRESDLSTNHDLPSFSSGATADKLTISIKKPWNRFGSGKKVNTRDLESPQSTTTKTRSCTDPEETNDPSIDKKDTAKPNKLQKLINKMECTLGKQPSGKSVNSLANKTQNGE